MKTPRQIAEELVIEIFDNPNAPNLEPSPTYWIEKAIEAERERVKELEAECEKVREQFSTCLIEKGAEISDNEELQSKLTESINATQELSKQLKESQLERVRLERALEKAQRAAKLIQDNPCDDADYANCTRNCESIAFELEDAICTALSNPSPNKIRDEIKAAERVVSLSRQLNDLTNKGVVSFSAWRELTEAIKEHDAIKRGER
ncbi:MAG TPA: flagellar protein FliT [Chitinophagaceae bacterium]